MKLLYSHSERNMLWRVIFILTLHFVWITSALQCHNCSQVLNLPSSERVNTTRPECSLMDAQYSSCSQLLHIRYPEKKASILFEASPSESLILSNAAQMMTNTTMIWLDKIQFDRTFQIFCFDTNACTTDSINNIYVQGKL